MHRKLLLHITMNVGEVLVPPFPRFLRKRVILIIAKFFPNDFRELAVRDPA